MMRVAVVMKAPLAVARIGTGRETAAIFLPTA
jgi:hypothetical protein